MKTNAFVGFLIMFCLFITACSVNNQTDINPPRIYVHTENATQAELLQLNLNWDYGSSKNPDVRQWDTGREAYDWLDLSNWDEILNIDLSNVDIAPLLVTIGTAQVMKLSTQKDKIVGDYTNVLSYIIWHTDGTLYDDGYSGLVGFDEGVVFLTSPFDLGEYVYEITLEFKRGTVQYAFKVVVE